MPGEPLGTDALATLFLDARTHYDWAPGALSEATLHRLHDLAKMGPTSANCAPARFLFCTGVEARETLAGCAADNNAEKIRAAPCTIIIGMDLDFIDKLPALFPHADAASWFRGNPALIRETALRNSSLQGAYLILAARSLGLDTGPMSGFDKARVDAAFWAGTSVETNFLCSIGIGTGRKLFSRLPRLPFDEAARLL